MELRQVGDRWLARKNKKSKTEEDVTDLIHFDGDFASVMGKAGRTSFHSYLGKSGKRWLEMHGVTSLLNYWGEKDRLIQWSVDKAVDFLVENKNDLHKEIADVGDWHWNEGLFNTARSAHKKKLEEAGDHGTDVHAFVETYIKCCLNLPEKSYGLIDPYGASDDERVRLKDFVDWACNNNVKFLASEKPLHSKKLWAAGTCDFVCEIDGKRYIGDLKTSNYVSYKHFVQCGAYALMYEEMGFGKIDGIVIVHMPRSGGFNVHTDMGVDNYQDDFRALVRMVKRDKDKSYQLYN